MATANLPAPEEWRPCEGFDYPYEVSNYGRFRRAGGRILNLYLGGNGYAYASVRKDGRWVKPLLHRLVIFAFLPPAPGQGYQVNHKDAVKTNNHVGNLEWVTPRENIRHAIAMGLRSKPSPQPEPYKLTSEDAEAIRTALVSGVQRKYLAVQYGVAAATIYHIQRGIARKDRP